MKKHILSILSLLLAFMMIIAFVGCDTESESSTDDENSSSQTSDKNSQEDDENKIKCPDFIGLQHEDILELQVYEDKSLVFEFQYEYSDEYGTDIICAQSIAEDELVKKGTTIVLTVSMGSNRVNIPNVINMDELTAKETLEAVGFKTIVAEIASGGAQVGKVVMTDPANYAMVERNSTITIYIGVAGED